jgi:amidase
MGADRRPELSITDTFNGIVLELRIEGATDGRLAGKTFVAKDLFDVAGHTTGAGNPTWLKTHQPAATTASAIQMLLDAGATLVGKSCTDEIAFSLDGINIHYGTPINTQAPDRIPGGSSSGSASAVAAGLVDFALGTDTAGSVRVPASYCGIYGFRPTHGAVPIDAVVPLGPSFDTVGWFARDAELLQRCGQALLKLDDTPITITKKTKVKLVSDGFNLLTKDLRHGMNNFLQTLYGIFDDQVEVKFGIDELQKWATCFSVVRSWEAWNSHKDWIEAEHPVFAPEISERILGCKRTSLAQFEAGKLNQAKIIDKIKSTMGDASTFLCLPTTYSLPPKKTSSEDELSDNRKTNILLCCISSIAGLPQVTIPIHVTPEIKSGVSFIGMPGTDANLLQLAVEVERLLRE